MINREEIIRMAREAGYQHPDAVGTCEDFAYFDLERFAALVEAKASAASASVEREKVARWQIGSGYTTGHGDTIEDLLVELEWQVREAEREACAKVCDVTITGDEYLTAVINSYADFIRARG